MSPIPKKMRVVVDLTGGAIHAVYADLPVEVLFFSSEPDDLDQEQRENNFLSTTGIPVAMWMDGDDVGDQVGIVDHYFVEYMKPAVGSA